jgi:RND family efflux transporter MFP subunit
MEECYDQETAVLYDPSGATGGDAVTRQAAALSRGQGGHIVLLLPLRRHADIEGVICLEFLPTVQLTPKVMEDLSLAVDLLAPQLYDRHANDRWLITKAGLSLRHVLEETLGPKYWIPKLITFAVIAIILFITNFFDLLLPLHVDIRPMYTVSAPFTFAAVDKRSLSAPYDGYIHDVYKKPGESVKAGEPLLKMDTIELELKKAQAESDALAHGREAHKDYGDQTKLADYKVAMAQHDESQAEADLYQWQIGQAVIKAPFDGEVLKSNVEDKVGSPVKQGDELMLVAQQGNLRAELSANERDIQDLKPGQTGKLATTSLPTEKYPFTIDRVVPLGQAKEGNNVFTVYAQLDKVSPSWLPGMQGEVRVDVERRTWAWMWTHRLIDFIRLKIWM